MRTIKFLICLLLKQFFLKMIKKLKKINKLISLKISKIFDTQGNTITIFNNFIDKKNFNHNFINGSSEKRIFIKISGLSRSAIKKEVSKCNY